MGLIDPDGCTGKDVENRFDRGAVFVVASVWTDIVLAWLWKLARPDEPPENVELVGEATCSMGVDLADIGPFPCTTS